MFRFFGCLDFKRPGRMFRMLPFAADVYFAVIDFNIYMYTLAMQTVVPVGLGGKVVAVPGERGEAGATGGAFF